MKNSIKIGNNIFKVESDDSYLDWIGDEFEPHMVSLFNEIIKKDDVVFDIGANIGLTAILFSNIANKVIAFEPSPSTFNILNKNIASNNLENIIKYNMGLGEKKEKLTITFAENNRSGGFVSNQTSLTKGHFTEDILIDSLDNFIKENPTTIPSVIKIDVEGFEQNVIKGGLSTLQKYKPIVIMEMNHFCLNVLHRITIPDFIEYMCSVFPYLYAIDTDNSNIKNLHDKVEKYNVMHEHVVHNKYPNIVGSFNDDIKNKLDSLVEKDTQNSNLKNYLLLTDINIQLAPDKYLLSGWSPSEGEYVWSNGEISTMQFLLEDKLQNKDIQITLNGFPFVYSNVIEQGYEVFANGMSIKNDVISKEGNIELFISKKVNKKKLLTLELKFLNCTSPQKLNLSDDSRMLAFALKTVEVRI